VDEEVEHLRLDRDQLAAAPQLPPLDIKYMIIKDKLRGICPGGPLAE
jgi:hypothetical protein